MPRRVKPGHRLAAERILKVAAVAAKLCPSHRIVAFRPVKGDFWWAGGRFQPCFSTAGQSQPSWLQNWQPSPPQRSQRPDGRIAAR